MLIIQWLTLGAIFLCGTMVGYYLSKSRHISRGRGEGFSRGRGEGFMLAVKIYRESFYQMEQDKIITVDWDRMHKSIADVLKNKSEPLKKDGNVVHFPTPKDK